MDRNMSRRQYLQLVGLSGLTAGLTGIGSRRCGAQGVGESSGFESSVISSGKRSLAAASFWILDSVQHSRTAR